MIGSGFARDSLKYRGRSNLRARYVAAAQVSQIQIREPIAVVLGGVLV